MLHIINLSLVPGNYAMQVRLMHLSYSSLTPVHSSSLKSVLINSLAGFAGRAWSSLAARLGRYTDMELMQASTGLWEAYSLLWHLLLAHLHALPNSLWCVQAADG